MPMLQSYFSSQSNALSAPIKKVFSAFFLPIFLWSHKFRLLSIFSGSTIKNDGDRQKGRFLSATGRYNAVNRTFCDAVYLVPERK